MLFRSNDKKIWSVADKLAVLFVYTNGAHHAKSRWGGDYETYSYGCVPTDPLLTKKARKDIEANGINWVETSGAYEDSMSRFEGTDHDSSTLHYYSADIVSNSGDSYRFSISIQHGGLAFIFNVMDELKDSPLLK